MTRRGARPAAGTAILIAGLFAAALAGCAPEKPMFPRQADAFTADGEAERYGPDDLFGYIDGAAEVYRAFGVRRTLAQRYRGPNEAEIVADVFEMETPSGAYGAYHHDLREGEPLGFGQESEASESAIAFWKGRHFVSIVAIGESDAAPRAMRAIAAEVEVAIAETGEPPAVAALLPESGVVRGRVHYFRSAALLNRYYYLADEDLLGLDGAAEGIIAAVRPAGADDAAPLRVMSVRYPAPAAAEAALERLRAGLAPDADATGLAQTEAGTFLGARARGRVLVAVFEARSREAADAALAAVLSRVREEER